MALTDKGRRDWMVFNGRKEDFPVWQERFVARMRKQKLHNALFGKTVLTAAPAPVTGEDTDGVLTAAFNTVTQTRATELLDLEDKEDQIYCELVTYLDSESLMFIRHDCKRPDGSGNGFKAWKMLCDRFISKEKPAVMSITSQLTNLRLEGGEKVSSYLLRSQELLSQLRNAGENMSDTLVNSFVLQGLPIDFESFVTMESFNPSTSTIDLRHRIQVFADAREQKAASETNPNVAYFTSKPKVKGPCHGCGKMGHYKRDCQSSNVATAHFGREGAGRGAPRCGNCNKKGHKSASCWAKGGGAEGKGPHTNVQACSCTYHAMCSDSTPKSTESSTDYEVNLAVPTHSFVLDSGCTDHMLVKNDLFTDYTVCADDRVVRSANQSTSKIAGFGTAQIAVKDITGNKQVLVLHNALHVPQHGRNLLSVKCAVSKGNSIELSPDKSVITLRSGTQIPVRMDNNLFMVMCEPTPESECNSASVSNIFSLWHRRMGHVNATDLCEILSKSGVLSSSNKQFTPSDLPFCEPCVLSKLTKATVPKSVESRAGKPLERVFSDVCGPFQASLGGCKYVISFIDEFTRFAVLKFMSRKSESLRCFQEYVAEFGVPGRLRSDNGGEYTSKAFEEFCRSRSVAREFTVPQFQRPLNRTVLQNGIFELQSRWPDVYLSDPSCHPRFGFAPLTRPFTSATGVRPGRLLLRVRTSYFGVRSLSWNTCVFLAAQRMLSTVSPAAVRSWKARHISPSLSDMIVGARLI